MDYPGHFKRRIKSVSISIPCIAGPYTSVYATLRLLNNKFRNTAIANNYPEKTDEQDDRFISYNIPIMAIATSSAQNDAGMFELNFKDERYLPFEGAGVISRWKLELPQVKQFDYNTIADVVLHVKYIASDGGDQLKRSAVSLVNNYLSSAVDFSQQGGMFAFIDMKHDMPGEWNLLVKNGTANITIDKSRLSYLVQSMNNLTASIIFISKKQINRLKSTCVSPVAAINFHKLPEMDLFISQSLVVSLDTSFEIYGYKTIAATPTSTEKEVVDNTELKLIDDLVMVIKYSSV